MRVVTVSFKVPGLDMVYNALQVLLSIAIVVVVCSGVYLEASGRWEQDDGDLVGGSAGWLELLSLPEPKELCTRSTICI